MVTLYLSFKRIVTAFLALILISSAACAQVNDLDPLFEELLSADDNTHTRVATEILKELERSGSPAMDLLYRRGAEALEEAEFGVAAEHFTALVDHAPDFAEGYHGRANAYFNLGYVGPALADLRTTLALEPRHFQAMLGLGNILESLEQLDVAKEIYEAVIEIYPLDPDALASLDRIDLLLRGQTL